MKSMKEIWSGFAERKDKVLDEEYQIIIKIKYIVILAFMHYSIL